MVKKLYHYLIKPPFILVYLLELLFCFLLIFALMTISEKQASTAQESLVLFLAPYALCYVIIKGIQYHVKRAFLEILPFSYISVSYLLQFHTTLERLAGDKNLTDSVMVITLMLVIINSIDKGFDSYKRFKEAKEHS